MRTPCGAWVRAACRVLRVGTPGFLRSLSSRRSGSVRRDCSGASCKVQSAERCTVGPARLALLPRHRWHRWRGSYLCATLDRLEICKTHPPLPRSTGLGRPRRCCSAGTLAPSGCSPAAAREGSPARCFRVPAAPTACPSLTCLTVWGTVLHSS